ncbi:MAG: hypothetical protein NVSMB49_19040 [Ktedonobacteraceae bacterium]
MKDMANREVLRYLTEPLCTVALHHLHSDEDIITSIYVHHNTSHVREREYWFAWERQVQLPARAFVLTPERALLLDDPTDLAATTAEREYLVASFFLNHVMLFGLRSHLLDCALTLVVATSHGPEWIIIKYNGVASDHFLAAVAYMRAVVDHQYQTYEVSARERAATRKEWHSVLTGVSLKQEYEMTYGLVPGEHIQGWLIIPTLDESTWWQRLGIGTHEQPEAMIVRTDRQILLVKETKRIIRGQKTYGSDSWLIPLRHIHTVRIVSTQEKLSLQITLEHRGVTEVVRLPVLPELTEQVLTLVSPSQAPSHGI